MTKETFNFKEENHNCKVLLNNKDKRKKTVKNLSFGLL